MLQNSNGLAIVHFDKSAKSMSFIHEFRFADPNRRSTQHYEKSHRDTRSCQFQYENYMRPLYRVATNRSQIKNCFRG